MDDLKQTYIDSDNLYTFVKAEFLTYNDWLEYEDDNAEKINSWEAERLFRIIESSKQGLIEQSIKGNAAAVSHLRSLLGLGGTVGRPRGKNGDSLEKRDALDRRLLEDYAYDIDRMA
jgi:hypothetical protein